MFGAVGTWKVCEILGPQVVHFHPQILAEKKIQQTEMAHNLGYHQKMSQIFCQDFALISIFANPPLDFLFLFISEAPKSLLWCLWNCLDACIVAEACPEDHTCLTTNGVCVEKRYCAWASCLDSANQYIFIFHTYSFSKLPLDAIKWSWLPD